MKLNIAILAFAMALILSCAGGEPLLPELRADDCVEYPDVQGLVGGGECWIELPSPDIAGFVFSVEVPDGAVLDCQFPAKLFAPFTLCDSVSQGVYSVAAIGIELKDSRFVRYWNGDGRRANLVKLIVYGGEGGVLLTPIQVDDHEGRLLSLSPLTVSIGGE